MSKLRIFSSILCLAFVVQVSVCATVREEVLDSLMADHKLVFFGEGSLSPEQDSIRTLVENFYYDQFRNFQDPAAPYFLFMSRDAHLAMGVGGQVKMRGYFDWGGAVSGSSFVPYDIPMTPDPLSRQRLGTNPSGSALFFRVIGRNHNFGVYQLYIEANFNGYHGRDFHLKKSYATVGDWTVGYTSSTFGDGAAVPPTVDGAGPTMNLSATAMLVRWMHSFKNKDNSKHAWVVAASVEAPKMALQEVKSQTAARSEYLPNVAAFVQYEWSRHEHVRLAAITRFMPYRNLLTATNEMPVGWGVQLSSVASPMRNLTLYATVNGGSSYSNFGGDFLLGQYDLVTDPGRPGVLKRVPGIGYIFGVQYDFSSRLFSTVSFGQGRYLPTEDRPATDYKRGTFAAVDLFWNITPRIRTGAEFCLGERTDFSGAQRFARRAGAIMQFSF